MATMECPIVSLEETIEVVVVMQRQERSTYLRTDYLTSNKANNTVLDAVWRRRIVEWMFGVVDHCSLRRDSVAIAAYYLDLTVERGVIESRQDYQLAAMTALQLAIKLYDSTVVKLDSMIKLGRGLFSEQDVVNMELKILHALKWQVHPPTPICFLRQFIRLLPSSVAPLTRYMIAEVTRFISEISVCFYKFVSYPSSAVAYAGMLMAMERINCQVFPQWQRQQIYDVFSTALNLQHDSKMIKNIITCMHQSLDNSVSLEDLINTIDQQCRGVQAAATRCVSNDTIPSCDPSTVIQPGMRSPREVATNNIQVHRFSPQ